MSRPPTTSRTRSFPIPASVLLVVAIFGVAATLAFKFYEVTESEHVMASRTRSAYAAFAAAELSREATRLVDEEVRRVLLQVRVANASLSRPPIPPGVLLDAAAGTPGPDDAMGLLHPWLTFRLELPSGRYSTAVAPGAEGRDMAATGAWVLTMVEQVLEERRASGQSEHGPRIVAADGTLITMTTVPDDQGRVRLIYGMLSDADDVVGAVAEHVMDFHTLLPLAPLGGTRNREALRMSLHSPGGRVVASIGGAALPGLPPVELSMTGSLSQYTVRASLVPEFALELAEVSWTWNQAHLSIILLGLCAGLIVMALWQVRRERALTQLRSDFVASVSHDLRTPLAQIRMFAEMLRLGWVRSDEERKQAVDVIDHESRRLTNLVENVLQFSGRELPPRRLLAQPVAFADMLQEVARCFEISLAHEGTRIQLDVEPGLVVHADDDALRQILVNLIDNAVKYGPRGQVVTVGGEMAGVTGARIWVEDQGPGIPLSERRRIFEPYRRGRRHVEAGIVGNGIGLTVVRDLAHAHGGSVWVEAADPRGARVMVTFPSPEQLPPRVDGQDVSATHDMELEAGVTYHSVQVPSP